MGQQGRRGCEPYRRRRFIEQPCEKRDVGTGCAMCNKMRSVDRRGGVVNSPLVVVVGDAAE
jgi:hypothetical protein